MSNTKFNVNLFIFLGLNIHLAFSSKCNEKIEIQFENSCYKLLNIDLIKDLNDCDNNRYYKNIHYFNCYKNVLFKLIDMYTTGLINDEKLKYDFIYLDNNEHKYKELLFRLTNKYNTNFNINNLLKIFTNVYSFDGSLYIENTAINDENPNLMIHSDDIDEYHGNDYNVNNEKCIYGHQVKSNNESFQFKNGHCDKKLPFICVKSFIKNNNINERCLNYRQSYPGGNWIECDKLNRFMLYSNQTKITKSQKCCLYNINWQENFDNSNKICSLFDSNVYTFKLYGYETILENYASYLNINYGKTPNIIFNNSNSLTTNLSLDYLDFWTSCKLVAQEPVCLNNLNEDDINSKMYNLPILPHVNNGLDLFYYDFESNKLKEVNHLNLTLLLDAFTNNFTLNSNYINCSNQSDIECFDTLIKSYINNTVFLGKRSLFSNKITKIVQRVRNNQLNNSSDCFLFIQNNNSVLISIPFLNKCYHFSLIQYENQSNIDFNSIYQSSVYKPEQINIDLPLKSINQNIINSLLNTLGIIKFYCRNDTNSQNSNSFFITPFISNAVNKFKNCNENNITTLALTSFNKFNTTSIWLNKLYDKYLKDSKFILILNSYSQMIKKLELNCDDKLNDLLEVIEKCNRFYLNKFCLFKCPLNCEYNDGHILWQHKQFSYLYSSRICQAAYHSNLFYNQNNHGILFIESTNTFSNQKTNEIKNNTFINNNDINTIIWPPVAINYDFDKYKKFYFRLNFNELIRTRKESNNKFEQDDFFVLVKAINILGEMNLTIQVHSLFNSKFKSKFIKLIEEEEEDKSNTNKYNINEILEINSIDMAHSLNNYYQLTFDGLENRIKFPINFILKNSTYILPNENIVLLKKNETAVLNASIFTINDIQPSCYWGIMNKITKIPCLKPINLNYSELNDHNFIHGLSNQNMLIYPNYKINLKIFTRVMLSNMNSNENKCQNGGLIFLNKCLCLPGFKGEFCQDVCEENHFGSNCQFKCPNNECKSYLICNQEPIGCSCPSGYKGLFCNESCSNEYWGPGCKLKCNEKCIYGCNSFNGDCICKNKNIKGKFCDICANGFYGKDCTDKCLFYCDICDKIDGKCMEENNSVINITVSQKCEVRLLNSNSISLKNHTINNTELIIINNYNSSTQLLNCFFNTTFKLFCQPILDRKLSIQKLTNLNSYHLINENITQHLCSLFESDNLIKDINSFLDIKQVDYEKNLISLELKPFNISNNDNLFVHVDSLLDIFDSNKLINFDQHKQINLDLTDHTTNVFALSNVTFNDAIELNIITFNSLKVPKYANSSQVINYKTNCLISNKTNLSCTNIDDLNESYKHLELIIWLLTIVIIALITFTFNLIIKIKRLKSLVNSTEFDFNLY